MATNRRKSTAPKKRPKVSRTQRKSARPKLVQPSAEALAKAKELTIAGVNEQQAGELDKAAALYRKALNLVPEYPHALHFLGVVNFQKGAHEKARKLIERAIAIDPNHAKFFSNLGAVQVALGDRQAAVASLRDAVRLEPGNVGLHANLATALRKIEDWDGAIKAYENAPPAPRILHRLGNLYNERERFDDAVRAFERYLEQVPDDAEVHNNVAFALEKSDRLEAAEQHYRRALELAPESPEMENNLGVVLQKLDRKDEAEIHLKRARDADIGKWNKPANFAALQAKLGRYLEALEIYKRLLDADPDHPGRLNDYGMALLNAGRPLDSLEYLDRAIEIDPDFALAYCNRASSKSVLNDRPGAVDDLRKALSLRPGMLAALVSIGINLLTLHRYDEAYFFARSLVMAEGYVPALYSNPHKVFRSMVDFDAIEDLGDIWSMTRECEALGKASMFLELLAICETETEIEMMAGFHGEWYAAFKERVNFDPLPVIEPTPGTGRIRLGFLSSDLRSHSVAKFVMPLFKNLDRDAFDICCYSPMDVPEDKNQQRFKNNVNKFRIVKNNSDREVAEIIRDDGVDILFELNGFTQNTKIGTLAYRAAPVQVEWLGYPFTTGIEEIDYLLLDPHCRPEKDSFLTEKVLEMPESWVCFGEYDDDLIIRQLPYERNDGVITFGTLNNPYKFTPAIVDMWAQALHRVPDSRFLFVRPECRSKIFVSNVCKEFGKRGIGPERLYFVNNRGTTYEIDEQAFQLNHIYYYDEIDISLDTFPVTGGTTTTDALWMGVPVISLFGPSLHHRISYSILKSAGLGDLCTDSRETYVDLAVALASDHERLRDIRHHTRDRLRVSPLCDGPRFAENFQNLMLDVVERHKLR